MRPRYAFTASAGGNQRAGNGGLSSLPDCDFQRRLGRARRPRDTRARRYISRQLNIADREAEGDVSIHRQIGILRRMFTGKLPAQVECAQALSEIRDLRLEGPAFRTRLEALRESYRLNPPDDSG